MVDLPKIYKKSKTGAVVYCEIRTTGADIEVETGQVGTDKPTFHHTTCEPKNVGRVNEKTAEEQADIEAIAKHTKKIKEGYTLREDGESGKRLPMKVKCYQEQKKNVTFPCWMSPKLDGVNGEIRHENDWEILSRGGDPYPILHDLNFKMFKKLGELMPELGTRALNGELYKKGVHLQDIQSATAKANELTPELEFHIFDICDSSFEYSKKVDILMSIEECDYVKVIDIKICHSHEEIEAYHTECVAQGYEGIVIRNSVAIYEYNVRSSNVFKYKIPKDGEYCVIGHKIDKHGHAVWECICNISIEDYFNHRKTMIPKDQKVLDKEYTFSVKRKGSASDRLAEAAIAEEKHGEWLKIEFESFSKLQKPLKPVGIVWRDCDVDGNPLV